MKDRLEKFVMLPFTAGCISESSIPIVQIQHTKRSKQGNNSTPTGKHEAEKDNDDGYLNDEESLSGKNWKTTFPRLQKLYKNFSELFVYKDEVEAEMGMEIGLPTDVKHVSHIGLDGCARSIFSKGGNEEELINLHSFPLSELDLAIKTQAHTSMLNSLLETKCDFDNQTDCNLEGTMKYS